MQRSAHHHSLPVLQAHTLILTRQFAWSIYTTVGKKKRSTVCVQLLINCFLPWFSVRFFFPLTVKYSDIFLTGTKRSVIQPYSHRCCLLKRYRKSKTSSSRQISHPHTLPVQQAPTLKLTTRQLSLHKYSDKILCITVGKNR